MKDKNNSNLTIVKTVWASIAVYILFFGYINFIRYHSFDYRDFDFAIHTQIIWNILHGSIYNSILGVDFIANHAHLISFLIAPLYLIFQHPLTLIFLQTIALAMAAYPIFLIAKEEINEKIGLAVVFIYLLYPALGYINLYEFHTTPFATLFLAWMFYYFKKEQFKKFIIFMILALLCQENIPLIIVPFGIYAFFTERHLKWSLTPLFLGSIWFLVMVGAVIPYFNRDTIQIVGSRYSHMGKSIPEIIDFIISRPYDIGRIIFTKQKIIYMAQIFGPVSFFCLLDPRFLIMAPLLLQHLLSNADTEHTIYYHYTAEMIPVIFISSVYGIKRFLKIAYVKKHIPQKVFIGFLVMLAAGSNIYLGPHLKLIKNIKNLKKNAWDYHKQRLLNQVPDKASVVATFEFLPKLANRKKLYSFHHVVLGFYTSSNKPYKLPEGVEYALIDFNDHLTFNNFYRKGISDVNIRNFILSGQWGVYDMLDNIVLLKGNQPGKYMLYEVLEKLPAASNICDASANNELKLLGYDARSKKISKGIQIELVLYWEALKKTKNDYANFIDITDMDGKIKARFLKPICYRAFPVYAWGAGQIVREDYNLFIPGEIKSDACSVKMGIFDFGNKKIYPVFSHAPDTVDKEGRIILNINNTGE